MNLIHQVHCDNYFFTRYHMVHTFMSHKVIIVHVWSHFHILLKLWKGEERKKKGPYFFRKKQLFTLTARQSINLQITNFSKEVISFSFYKSFHQYNFTIFSQMSFKHKVEVFVLDNFPVSCLYLVLVHVLNWKLTSSSHSIDFAFSGSLVMRRANTGSFFCCQE